MEKWPVVPLCERQLRDVKPQDILEKGNLRVCDVYKGGGGYDHFPAICNNRLGKRVDKQLVTQLAGCVLACPYCYVTHDGIWGKPVTYTSQQLVDICMQNNLKVFHLMGGAPALYIDQWYDVINRLPDDIVFHSDLLLVESNYNEFNIKQINGKNCLYAVSIKGEDEEEFRRNTGKKFNKPIFFSNLDKIIKARLNFYFTFTGMSEEGTDRFKDMIARMYGEAVLEDSFNIAIKKYKALE